MISQIFPIGDLHIHTRDEAAIFSDYLNQRPEELVILLGDVVHFSHSFWSPSTPMIGRGDFKASLDEDLKVWVTFFGRLKKLTIAYYGTHEMYAFEECARMQLDPPSHPSKINPQITVPLDCCEYELPDGSHVAGLHIPSNVYPRDSSMFETKRKAVEKYLDRRIADFRPRVPRKTVFCTHEPTDHYYSKMGYGAITGLLVRVPFKAHYHAHIHSNLRDDIVGGIPSINRSVYALYRFRPEALEPIPRNLRELLEKRCTDRKQPRRG